MMQEMIWTSGFYMVHNTVSFVAMGMCYNLTDSITKHVA